LPPEKQENILIEGDNYHALSVLNYTHKGYFDAIYADPPYNTGATDWKYNNDYVDGIGEGKLMLSPVIAAIREVLLRHNVSLTDKHVTIVGKGRLVGAPAAQWLHDEGIHTTVVTEGDDVAHANIRAVLFIDPTKVAFKRSLLENCSPFLRLRLFPTA
jgi:hypothetical protein